MDARSGASFVQVKIFEKSDRKPTTKKIETMNTRTPAVFGTLVVVFFALCFTGARAQLPSDFPRYNVVNYGGAAPGSLIGQLGGRTADGTKSYYVVLDNTGTNVLFYSKTQALSRFVMPNGLIAVAVTSSNGFRFIDETFREVDFLSVPEGYTLDTHDVHLLCNGHALLMSKEVRPIDMSKVVPGGRPDALVTGNVVQEIDANKRVVFEWHTLDHIPITDSFYDLTQKNIDYAHINAVGLDPIDHQLLISLRTTSEIVKINRQTGEVIWRLGGKGNQFTFIGEHEENAPYYTVGQHDMHRLANGHLIYFDNGNISGGGVTPCDRNYSRIVEYQLDEVNKVATLVWEYWHTPDISAPCTGYVNRFANGNTLIDWGCGIASSGTLITEVSPSGNVVFEITYPNAGPSGFMTKQVWNSTELAVAVTNSGIVAGQIYDAAAAGVSVSVNSFSGLHENELIVCRHFEAARFPQFDDRAPQVLLERVTLSGTGIDSISADIEFALPNNAFCFDTPLYRDPAELTVYHRPTNGFGMFTALPTVYELDTQTLRVTNASLGEFIFGFPDLAEIPLTPLIYSPTNLATVNQEQPVVLDWAPRGFVRSYRLQIARDAEFNNLVVDTNLTESRYTLETVETNTQYYWRVNVSNGGGTSDWATASFTTVPQVLQITYPAGGEVWCRFQVVTIRWIDNIAENVALDVYKGGVSNRTFVTSTPSIGCYVWTVGQFQPFPPGSDYTIKIRSVTNPNVYDFSEPFSIIEPPVLDPGAVTVLSDGRVQIALSVPGALKATVLGSTNLLDWEILGSLPLTDGRGVFVDDAATNFTCRFYRLRVP